MRAGALDRRIEIQAVASGVDDYGAPIEQWSTVATVWAQLVEATTREYQRAYGEGRNTSPVFRIRWRSGITTDQRVVHDGKRLNIREIKEIGRCAGLELRCEEVRA